MKHTLSVLILFLASTVIAQLQFKDEVLAPLQENQLYFEKVFIHTNKTSYSFNDAIWFKAYVSGNDNKPSLRTTLLYVNLLNDDGEIIQSKDILINEGTGIGQFELNDFLQTGKYYIKAYTNYMQNFGKENVFTQEVNILNQKIEYDHSDQNLYDIQIFPEGGELLENTENVIGIKSLINGVSYEFSGTIVNSKNEEVAKFKSQYLGMTKCNFFYQQKEKYQAIINVLDTIMKVDVPIAKSQGIIFKLSDEKKAINLSLRTNKSSLSGLGTNRYHLLFHQRNQIVNFFEIEEIKSLDIDLKFEKQNLPHGVNTITMFENNEPILERKFYVEKTDEEVVVSLREVSHKKDSIEYQLDLSNSTVKSGAYKISLSVLPMNRLNYNYNTTIRSAFLLTPYIKGHIEKPAYYFDKQNSERLAHLDLLLLTQGWTKYSTKEMIEDLNPGYKYDFEIGFKLQGNVSPLATNHLALISKKDLLVQKIFLDDKKEFSFNKLLVYKGDTVKVSFLDETNTAIKPIKMSFASIKARPSINLIPPKKIGLKNENIDLLNNEWEAFYDPNSKMLEEVIVLGSKRKEGYYERKELVEKYRDIVSDIGQYYNLKLPEKYRDNDDLLSFLSFYQGVRLVNWKGVENYLETGINKEAVLFVNGRRLRSEDLPRVSTIKMEYIESIMIKPYNGHKYIQVFTDNNYKNNISTLYREYIFNYGYDKAKKYYTPLYNLGQRMSNTLSEIDWKPNLTSDDSGRVSFKIMKSDNSLQFFIQGFSENGLLISDLIRDVQ